MLLLHQSVCSNARFGANFKLVGGAIFDPLICYLNQFLPDVMLQWWSLGFRSDHWDHIRGVYSSLVFPARMWCLLPFRIHKNVI